MLSKKQLHPPHKTDTGIPGNWLGEGVLFLSKQMCIGKRDSVSTALSHFVFILLPLADLFYV